MEYKSAKDTWKKSGIYIIKNTLDDRVYIGSTNNFRERFRSHRNKLKIGKNASLYLQNFCNKYGIDKLNFEVLEIIEDINSLLKREEYWLKKLKPEFNLMLTPLRQNGYKHKDETIQKMKQIARASFDNGRKSWNKGKYKISDEDILIIKQKIASGEKQNKIAKEYKVANSVINKIHLNTYK